MSIGNSSIKMLMAIFLFLWAVVATQTEAGPSPGYFGNCYDIQTASNFDFKAFTNGRWFEIARNDNFEGTADCAEQTLYLDEVGKTIDITYALRFQNGSLGLLTAAVNYTLWSNETLLDVTYPDLKERSNLDVLKTDYTSYAIVYSCYQINNDVLPMKDERLWVLSREPYLSDEAEDAVNEGLIYNGDSLGAFLMPVNQDKCI